MNNKGIDIDDIDVISVRKKKTSKNTVQEKIKDTTPPGIGACKPELKYRFNLVKLNPMGFINPDYGQDCCPICRSLLTDKCIQCASKTQSIIDFEKCDVILHDKIHYHVHCHSLISKLPNNDNNKKVNGAQADIEIDSASESDDE